MSIKKIYISGKITGNEAQAAINFEMAENEILGTGVIPVNPLKLEHNLHGGSWHDCMKTDIKALCECDAIYMLIGWQDSLGAELERKIAARLGLSIVYESDGMVGHVLAKLKGMVG